MAKEIVVTLANGDKAGETLKQLTHQAAALKKEISGLKPGTEDFAKSAASLNSVKDRMADIDKQVKSTTQSSNAFKSALGSVLQQIPGFSQLSGVLGSLRGGVGGLTSGFGLLKGAIVATGIGALLLVITGLVGWFSKTEAGVNMLSGAFKGMGAVIDTLMGRLYNIGNTLRQLFSNPIQFFKDLGKDIANSAKEGYEFVQVMDDIEDRQRAMEISAKRADILVDQLLLQAKNVGKTFSDRLALLDQADAVTRKTYKEQVALSKEYLDAIEGEVAAEMKRSGQKEKTEDQDKRITAATLAYLDLLGQEIQKEEFIANRREQILGKQEAAKAKEIKANKTAAQVEAEEAAAMADAEKLIELQQEQAFLEAKNLLDKTFKADKKASDDEEFAYRKQLQDEEIAAEIALNELKKQQSAQAANATLSTFANAFGVIAGFQEQGSADWKAFATAQAGLTAIQGAINAYTSTAAIPIVGAVLAPIAAAAALATGVANVARIQSTQLPSAKNKGAGGEFFSGGYTGPGGKYDPAGIVHAGEVVWSQADVARFGGVRAVEAIRPTSRMNGYYNGGPVSPFKNNTGRSPIPSGNAGGGSGNAMFDYDQMAAAFDRRMDNKIRLIKVQNVVTETQDAMNVVNTIRDEANV
jgi:hypothetical protein